MTLSILPGSSPMMIPKPWEDGFSHRYLLQGQHSPGAWPLYLGQLWVSVVIMSSTKGSISGEVGRCTRGGREDCKRVRGSGCYREIIFRTQWGQFSCVDWLQLKHVQDLPKFKPVEIPKQGEEGMTSHPCLRSYWQLVTPGRGQTSFL